MFINRVTKVVNPRFAPYHPVGVRSVANSRRSNSSSNPPHMLTLGFINPKGQVTMAKPKRRRASRPRTSAVRRHRSTNRRSPHRRRTPMAHNPHRRMLVVHRRHRSHNPSIMGQKPLKLVEDLAALIVGQQLNNAVINILPATLTSNTAVTIASSLGVAIVAGYLASMVNKEFGKFVGYGGLANTASLISNALFPNGILATIGMGDFVPGKFAVPQNPVLDGNMTVGGPTGGGVMTYAYPAAYAA